MKRCSRCKAALPIDAFGLRRESGRNPTRKSACRRCANEANDRSERRLRKLRTPPPVPVSRVCVRCQVNLPMDSFEKKGAWRKHTCRTCTQACRAPEVRPERKGSAKLFGPELAVVKAKVDKATKGPRCARCSAYGSYDQIITRELPGNPNCVGWLGDPQPELKMFLCAGCIELFKGWGVVRLHLPFSAPAETKRAAA